jgi:type VI secretion system protein ImpL
MGQADPDKLAKKVRNLYFDEYIRLWTNYIADINIKTFSNLSETVSSLNVLSGVDSPIKGFLTAVGQETKLTKTNLPFNESGKTSDKIASLTEKLRGLISSTPIEKTQNIFKDPASVVDRRFKKIYKLTHSQGDSPPSINQVLNTLKDLYVNMSMIQSRGGTPSQAESGDIIARIEIEARNQPQPLSRWILALAHSTSRVTVYSVLSNLNRRWQTDIAQFCNDALGSRYPLSKNSPEDATLNDFARFFGPQGSMDIFFKKNLKDMIDTSSRPWRVRRKQGVQVNISNMALEQLEYATKIRNAFFPEGGSQAIVKFRIKPVSLGKLARWVELDLGGQRLKFRNDAVRFQSMKWPPPSGSMMARLVFKPKKTAKETGIVMDGPWALFRLLDKGKTFNSTLRNRFQVSFNIKGQTATFELDSGSVDNPFRLTAKESFKCLDRL